MLNRTDEENLELMEKNSEKGSFLEQKRATFNSFQKNNRGATLCPPLQSDLSNHKNKNTEIISMHFLFQRELVKITISIPVPY